MRVLTYTNRNGKPTNQDSFYWSAWGDGTIILAVADGVGGLDYGEEGSKRVLQLVERLAPSLEGYSDKLGEINSELVKLHAGSTCEVCKVKGVNLEVYHLGDSRVYWVYKDRVECITRDHSALNQMIDKGVKMSRDLKRKYGHLLTKGVGLAEYQPPDLIQLSIPDDVVGILLCSDGFWHGLEVWEGAPELSDEWLEMVARKSIEIGVTDNITAVLGVCDGKL